MEQIAVIGSPTFSGSGSGYGHGYGSGYGYGDGDGGGYGSGSGSGDGSGYGHGYGSGYGYGYGYGDGSGGGSGYGHGYGSWQQFIPAFAERLTNAQRDRLSELNRQGATIAYWCSDSRGKPCNGGRGKPVSPGHTDTENGPLRLCAAGTLHATHYPQKWQGERWWIVALIGEVVGDGEKFGALRREIIGECIFD